MPDTPPDQPMDDIPNPSEGGPGANSGAPDEPGSDDLAAGAVLDDDCD
ncbi:MAG TPA: hypothetical protein VF636_10550 [Sphingomonas sp.]|jgi:hypothetical protein